MSTGDDAPMDRNGTPLSDAVLNFEDVMEAAPVDVSARSPAVLDDVAPVVVRPKIAAVQYPLSAIIGFPLKVSAVDDVNVVRVSAPVFDTTSNEKPSEETPVFGARKQLVRVRLDPVQLNSDVCVAPSDTPTTNFSLLNNDV
jgi:hypothetical protein